MCISDLQHKTPKGARPSASSLVRNMGAKRRIRLVLCVAISAFCILSEITRAEWPEWELSPIDACFDSGASLWTPSKFETDQPSGHPSSVRLLRKSEVFYKRMADATVALAEFEQPASEEPPQLPSYLNPTEDMPQPPLLDTQTADQSVVAQLDQLARRMDELEKTRIAKEDATRTIIRK